MLYSDVRCSLICLLAWAISAGGCAHTRDDPPIRINGSTPEAFHLSWDKLRATLKPQQQSQLDLAVLSIALGKYRSLGQVPQTFLDTGIEPEKIRTAVDGLTFGEIIELANKQPIQLSAP